MTSTIRRKPDIRCTIKPEASLYREKAGCYLHTSIRKFEWAKEREKKKKKKKKKSCECKHISQRQRKACSKFSLPESRTIATLPSIQEFKLRIANAVPQHLRPLV